jgi:hypothetical protein
MVAHTFFQKSAKSKFQHVGKLYPLDTPSKTQYNTAMNSTALRTINDAPVQGGVGDPAHIGSYPPTLPVEIALRVAPLRDICEAYGISKDQWAELRNDPVFRRDLTAAVEHVKQEGASVKLKAQLQCDELLKTSWNMIHDTTGATPPSVRADLIKHTYRVAGLIEPPSGNGNALPAMNIQINL